MSEALPLLSAFAERPDNLFALLYRYRVIVPVFQRHYVQGADNPKAKEVRETFIASLLKGESLHLNVIYGPICTDGEDAFTPVDGQQRLTTLWLLARYAAEQLPRGRERTGVLKLLARFSYAGRQHAERFCQALTQEENGWEKCEKHEKISESICRQPWFWPAWKEDETVDSMLRMLDTIHGQWEHNPGEVLEALHGNITFSLQTDSFADDIYMKMNARGLQLTQWENFKGKFAEKLTEDMRAAWNVQGETLSNRYFCQANPQLEPFENQKVSLPDDAFFALAARLLALQLRMDKKDVPEHLSALADFTAADWNRVELPFVPFREFAEALGVHADAFAQDMLGLLEFILRDGIVGQSSPYWQDARTLFESVLHPRNQNERDLAWLVCMWRKQNPQATEDDFTLALRCMWNILENDTREDSDRLAPFQKFFIQHCGPSLYGNSSEALPKALQWKEEVVKARIYNEHQELVKSLRKAEGYLHGRVRLALLDLGQEDIPAEICQERLGKLNELFEAWNEHDESKRKIIIMNLVAAQAYGMSDVFELNTKDGTLREMLTNRNDKDIQPHLKETISILSVPQEPFVAANYGAWQLKDDKPRLWVRDWRQVLLDIFNRRYGYGVYAEMIWGRHIAFHTQDAMYCAYQGVYVNGAIPINDWRIDLGLEESGQESVGQSNCLRKWFLKELEKQAADFRKFNWGWCKWVDASQKTSEKNLKKEVYFWSSGITVSVTSGTAHREATCDLNGDEIQELSDIPQCVDRNLAELAGELDEQERMEEGTAADQEA